MSSLQNLETEKANLTDVIHLAFQSVQDDGERQKRRKAHHSVLNRKLEGNSKTHP